MKSNQIQIQNQNQNKSRRQKLLEITNRLNSSQVSDMYELSIKLCTENKVNQKNSWSLNLIDYLEEVIDNQAKEKKGGTNFQVASFTIDASVKIYSYRVDSVLNEAYKILSGFNLTENTKKKNSKSKNQDDQLNSQTNQENEEDQSRKSKQRGSSTLEKNISNLNLKTHETNVNIDPLFKQITTSINESGPNKLLLNQLSVSENCRIQLTNFDNDSQNKTLQKSLSADPNEPDLENQIENETQNDSQNSNFLDQDPQLENIENEDKNHKKSPIDLSQNIFSSDKPQFNSMEICPSFHHFVKSNWSNFIANEMMIDLSSNISNFLTPDIHKDAMFIEATESDNDFEADMANDSIDDYGGDQEMTETNQKDPLEFQELDHILEQSYQKSQDEYTYLDTNIISRYQSNANNPDGLENLAEEFSKMNLNSDQLQNETQNKLWWLGSTHWKRRVQQQQNLGEAQNTDTSKSKRGRQRKIFLLNFSDPPVDKRLLKKSKNPEKNQLSQAQLSRFKIENTTLPEDIHYSAMDLTHLFNKPHWKIRISDLLDHRQANQNKFFFDNQNEHDELQDFQSKDPFLSGNELNAQTETNNDIDDEDDFLDAENPEENELDYFGELQLVKLPPMAQKIKINYARKPKNIDVFKLKKNIWNSLNDPNSVFETNQTPKNSKTKNVSFKKTIETLTQSKTEIPLKDLSPHFCFLALLHLANEHEFEIEYENPEKEENFEKQFNQDLLIKFN
ncbi:condensin complex subunit 2 [Anaeramoeba ignava]|uniref:Condensin complex subunit 2 n=1 Tax=Anaeramoeba ignava TaxID=1746090 RepID=A0A9Q0LHN9_ANAIG|nr:condensin complex subunit 2 [Anaeramoeba ignava]